MGQGSRAEVKPTTPQNKGESKKTLKSKSKLILKVGFSFSDITTFCVYVYQLLYEKGIHDHEVFGDVGIKGNIYCTFNWE